MSYLTTKNIRKKTILALYLSSLISCQECRKNPYLETDKKMGPTASIPASTSNSITQSTQPISVPNAINTPPPTPPPTPVNTPPVTPQPTSTNTPPLTPQPTPINTPPATPQPTPINTPPTTPQPTPINTPPLTPQATPIKTIDKQKLDGLLKVITPLVANKINNLQDPAISKVNVGNCEATYEGRKWPALHLAVLGEDTKRLDSYFDPTLCSVSPLQKNILNEDTALHVAVRMNSQLMVSYLMNKLDPLNQKNIKKTKNADGKTPKELATDLAFKSLTGLD
jgi:hypothetical protein